MKTETFVCHGTEQVKVATAGLSRAHKVDLIINDGGVQKPVDNFKGVYNSTLGRLASAVVPTYNVITHREYFDSFAEAMDRLNMEFTMSISECNNRAFADIEFKNRNLKFEKLNEEFITGIRLVNSYDKSSGVQVMPRFTRLACTNGMILTRSENTFSVKHHSKMLVEVESFIEKKLTEIINKDQNLQQWVSDSIGDTTEWNTVCRILEKMFKQPKHREEVLKRLGIDMITIMKKGKKTANFSYVWTDDKKAKKKLNRWDVYNAITSYLTHGEHMTPHIQSLFHKKAETMLITKFAKLPMVEVRV